MLIALNRSLNLKAYLASDAASYVSGTILEMDDGVTVATADFGGSGNSFASSFGLIFFNKFPFKRKLFIIIFSSRIG